MPYGNSYALSWIGKCSVCDGCWKIYDYFLECFLPFQKFFFCISPIIHFKRILLIFCAARVMHSFLLSILLRIPIVIHDFVTRKFIGSLM